MQEVKEKVSKINSIIEITMLRLCITLIEKSNIISLFNLGEELIKKHCDEISDGGFWVWNHKTNEVYYSPKFCKTLGYEYGELGVGFSGFHLGNSDQMKHGMQLIDEIINNNTQDTFVNIIDFTKKDGKIIQIECSGAVLIIENVPYIVLGTHKIIKN